MAIGAAQDIQAKDPEAEDLNGQGKDCLRWERGVRKAGLLVYKEDMRPMEMGGHGRK